MDLTNQVDGIFAAWKNGSCSAHLALMELLLLIKDPHHVVATIEGRSAGEAGADYDDLLRILAENGAGAASVARIARTLEAQSATCGSDAVRNTSALFDQVVGESEEASVALYSFGSPTILAEATSEVVRLLHRWDCLHASHDVLDIGCGIGRFEEVLAPRVRSLYGVDISTAMVERARRRTSRFANVRFQVTDGLDLATLPDGSFDLVLAIDSMPYIVDAGDGLVGTMFREVARVLRPGGELVLCGFSYRNDIGRDRDDVGRYSRESGFTVEVDGAAVFKLWDARVFRLRRP